MTRLRLGVNGRQAEVEVEDRDTLAEVLRDRLGLTGTRLACEHGVCGSCTVLLDGVPVRSCLLLGLQADGCQVGTIEGMAAVGAGGEETEPWAGVTGMRAGHAPDLDDLHPLQRALAVEHGLQCGFCTPGFVMLLAGALDADPDLDRHPEQLEEWLSSNLCRCTGYVGIRRALVRAAEELRST